MERSLKKPGRRYGLCALAIVLFFARHSAWAGDALVSENFDNFDLAKLPQNWTANNPAELSIAEDAAKGKVLRINHAAADGEAGISITLDIAKARGNVVRAKISGKCPDSYTPVPDKNGYPQLVILCRDAAGAGKGTMSPLQPTTNGWQDVAANYTVPADASSVTVVCRVLQCAADVYFDGLSIEIVPGVPKQQDIAEPPPVKNNPPVPPPEKNNVPAVVQPKENPPPAGGPISENFENFDLAKLPENFSINPAGAAAELSIAEDTAKGKVLRINHAAAPGEAGIAVSVDIAKARGNVVRASVNAKCPGGFTPVPEKYGYPQIVIAYFDAAGNGNGAIGPMPANTTGWVEIKGTNTIPATAAAVKVICRVQLCVADVFFDGLTIDIVTPAGQPVANGPAQQPERGKLPPLPAAPLPPEALQVQKKNLADDGVQYGPEVYVSEKAARKAGMTASTFAIVGPGLPNPDLDGKPPARWTLVPAAKEVTGISPEKLSSTLPTFIVKNKPEIVIIVGENKPLRKLSQDESAEWEDLVKICARFGAIPVLGIPADAKSELRKEMLDAAEATRCAVLELRAPLKKRMHSLFDLIEINIFERTPPPAEVKPAEE